MRKSKKDLKNAIVLCSGGLDSVVTVYYVKKLGYKKIIILFFDYGQRVLKEERKFSKECAKKLRTKFMGIRLNIFNFKNSLLTNKKLKINKINRKDLKNSKKESERFYVPFRNSIFLGFAVSLAENLCLKNKDKNFKIFVGFKNEGKESYPDTTKEFVDSFNKLIKTNKLKPRIIAPLIEKDKEDVILLGKKLGVDFKKTYSCYVGGNRNNKWKDVDLHCGTCLACRLRQEGFYWANINDPTNYNEKMGNFKIA